MKGSQATVLNSLPGSRSTACATVGSTQRDLRSGNVAVGNFVDARAQYKRLASSQEQPEISLYVIPEAAKARQATLKLSPLGHQATSRTVSTTTMQQAEQWTYFRLSVAVPSPGKWRITASTGKDTGCFDVTF